MKTLIGKSYSILCMSYIIHTYNSATEVLAARFHNPKLALPISGRHPLQVMLLQVFFRIIMPWGEIL